MNRGVWKYLVLMVGILSLSCAEVSGQDLGILHYWDKFNLSDSTLYKPAGGLSEDDSFSAMETEAAHFFSLLKNCPDSVARVSVDNLMNKAVLASGGGFDAYGQIMGIAEKYFYDVQSPYYCEEMLLPFLYHKIARSDIPEIEKSREKYLAMIIRRNAVGSKAEDFTFNLLHLPEQPIFTNGETLRPVALYEIVDIYHTTTNGLNHEKNLISMPLMTVFYSADCRDCLDGIDRLSHSPVVRERISSGKMNVLVVCVEGNSRSSVSKMPKDWIVAEDISEEYHKNIVERSLYSMRQTPSVYMLDERGVVLLRDASVSSAIQFLLEQ